MKQTFSKLDLQSKKKKERKKERNQKPSKHNWIFKWKTIESIKLKELKKQYLELVGDPQDQKYQRSNFWILWLIILILIRRIWRREN